MNKILKKIAYLKGLCDGYGISKETKEGKILEGILDVLDDMAEVLNCQDVLCDDTDDDAEYSYAYICPNCGQELEVDEDIMNSETELICPACGNIIPLIGEFADFNDEE